MSFETAAGSLHSRAGWDKILERDEQLEVEVVLG